MKEKILNYIGLIKREYQKMVVELRLPTMKQPFLWLLGIYLVATFSVIRADFKYIDDLGRFSSGYRSWAYFSRWISEKGSILVHDGKYLTDISPLTQLLALAIMAVAGVIVLRCFIKQDKIPLYGVLCVVPMSLSPYFLECLSYKFDSPYMALSVFGSVLPFLFWNMQISYFAVISLIGLLIMFNTYQAASGIYLVMAAFMLLKDFADGVDVRTILKRIVVVGAIYLFGVAVYKLLFVKEVDTYVSSGMASRDKLIGSIRGNIKRYFSLLRSDLPKRWIVYVYGIAVMALMSTVWNSKKYKVLGGIFAVLTVVICAVLSYGAYIVLEKPLFACRGMYGIGVYVAIMATFVFGYERNLYLDKVLCICLAWSCICYSATYGNALAEEKRYTDFRTEMTLADLNRVLPVDREVVQVQILGNASRSPVIGRMAQKYPVLRRAVPIHFNNSWWGWSDTYLFNYFAFPKIQKVWPNQQDFSKLNLPTVLETNYHTIKSDGKHVLVEVR